MTSAHTLPARKMTIREFLGFYETRPDGERWELIDGEPVMMTPPSLQHQIVASAVERQLENLIERLGLPMLVIREGGLQVDMSGSFRPEPEVAVVDRDIDLTRPYAARFYLVVEVRSPSDRRIMARKVSFYRQHQDCHTILVIDPLRLSVDVHSREDSTWRKTFVEDPDDEIVIASWGALCRVRDLYRRTPLVSRD